MKHTDIAIIGGGFADSTAAAMLGRVGHQICPFDFRVRKNQQRRAVRPLLPDRSRRFGAALGHHGENWITRFGYRAANTV
ncbi:MULTISPECIES: hypothetical protein [unclassified Bradyrhizobium]|uniref:hypothetical protein n=1 Tax=unclassified Bradyrhizobium TaxID=2631580 RepID=UPI002FF1B393